jgi:hypothetical protein
MQTAELCGHGAGRQALDLKIRKPPRKPRTTGPASQLRNLLKPRFENASEGVFSTLAMLIPMWKTTLEGGQLLQGVMAQICSIHHWCWTSD